MCSWFTEKYAIYKRILVFSLQKKKVVIEKRLISEDSLVVDDDSFQVADMCFSTSAVEGKNYIATFFSCMKLLGEICGFL